MAGPVKSVWRRTRLALGIWGLGIAVFGAGIFVAYQFVGPPPPRKVVLATGTEGGAYQLYGDYIAAYLASQGVEVELRKTAGAVENLELLGSDAGVDIGFVQGGLADVVPADGVVALGSLYLEPVWMFVKTDMLVTDVSDLTGKRIAAGAQGSGTRTVVLRLLAASGIAPESATLLDLSPDRLEQAFTDNEIDAAFLIGGPQSQQVATLISLDDVALTGLRRASAYVRYSPYLSLVALPEGVLNLATNIPDEDISTVAVAAMLAAREDLHPALNDLLLIAAARVFGEHSLLSDAGQFPTPRYSDLPLSKEAERYYEHGAPFLMRYLPFWAATLVDRLWVMLLPLIGLSIPLFKLMPPLYQWRIRRRLLQRYAALKELDSQHTPLAGEEDRNTRLQRLAELEVDSVGDIVPRSYSDDVYKLRRDMDLVRRRLLEARIDA